MVEWEIYDGEESSEEDDQTSTQDVLAEDELYDVSMMLPGREGDYLDSIQESTEEPDGPLEDSSRTTLGGTFSSRTAEETAASISFSELRYDSDENGALTEAIRSIEDFGMDDEPEFREWYDDPYGEDFIHDLSLIEDLWNPEKGWFRSAMISDWDQANEDDWLALLKRKALSSQAISWSEEQMTDEEYCLHLNIVDAIDLIKTPERAKEGIQILFDLLKEFQVDLNKYLLNLDYCLVRYIIWGLNFHFNRDIDHFIGEPRQDPKELLPPFEYRMMSMTNKMFQSFHTIGKINVMYWSMVLNWFVKMSDSRWALPQVNSDDMEIESRFCPLNQRPIDQC